MFLKVIFIIFSSYVQIFCYQFVNNKGVSAAILSYVYGIIILKETVFEGNKRKLLKGTTQCHFLSRGFPKDR